MVFHQDRLVDYEVLVNSDKTEISKTTFGDSLKGSFKIAVVDGANDLDLFEAADLRIAFNVQSIVRSRVDVSLEKERILEIRRLVAEGIRRRN